MTRTPALLLPALLLLSGPALAQTPVPPGPAQPADPCAGVSCPANSTCLLTNAGAICACDPGYAPEGVTGCKRQGCQSDEHCEAGTVCHAGKCIPGDTVGRYRKMGVGMLVPGIILMAAGAALVPTGLVMYQKTRYCYDTILGRACSHDRSMTEYTLYQIFLGLGLISLGGGIALTIIGAIKLRRAREIQGLASLPVEPFFAPAPGGGVIGLGGRF